MAMHLRSSASCKLHDQRKSFSAAASTPKVISLRPRSRSHKAGHILCAVSQQAEGQKTIIEKNVSGDLPFPWSEKDPYKLPVSIDQVQKLLLNNGWEKPWVEQVVDRIMKNMLRTTEERTKAVVSYLSQIGLRQDEICNMASISVVLLGLNPETRLQPVVNYLKQRGVPDDAIPDLVLKHPRIFEYKVTDGDALAKGQARIQVDVVPAGPNGEKAAAVSYFREGASFMVSPVSPVGPAVAAAAAAAAASKGL